MGADEEVHQHGAGSAYPARLGCPVRDLTAASSAIRREVLEHINLDTIEARGYAFQVENDLPRDQGGFRVVEIPITFRIGATGHRR
jgi:dolichol-phosphate mannosyltransferase